MKLARWIMVTLLILPMLPVAIVVLAYLLPGVLLFIAYYLNEHYKVIYPDDTAMGKLLYNLHLDNNGRQALFFLSGLSATIIYVFVFGQKISTLLVYLLFNLSLILR